jgi:hypothetical protein
MLRKIARKSGVGRALLWMRESKEQRLHAKWAKRNAAGLQALTDKHKGEDAVIVGMGPSLRIEDLELFGKMRSFACNKIYLAFDQVKWRPDYYSVCDVLVAENNKEQILSADFGSTQPLHQSVAWPVLGTQTGALCYGYAGTMEAWHPSEPALLGRDLSRGVLGGGYSVVLEQIQMAYAMGFRRVFLVGVDFKFALGHRTSASSASGEVLAAAGEQNHFHPNYRSKGESWTVPLLAEQKRAYAYCREAYSQDGRLLVNASRKSELAELDRVEFDRIFS